MVLHEKQKISKITEEITSFLLERKYKDISISLSIKEDETTFILKVKEQGEDLFKVFREELYCCREIELEEYGVDHLHNDDCVCTLNTLGMLVDTYEIKKEEDIYTITLHRLKV